MKNENLEKGFNVGDIHSNGKWVWTEWAPGKFDWRAIKKNKNSKTNNPTNQTPATPTTTPKPTSTTTTTDVPKSAPTTATTTKTPYDAPKPLVNYKVRSKYDYEVPESWSVVGKDGKPKMQTRAEMRKIFADKTKWDDDKLLSKVVNNKNMPNPNLRQLGWEEAAARGIPESKIDVSGSLKNRWDQYDLKLDTLRNASNDDDDDDFGMEYNSAIGNFDIEAFKSQFPNGDLGWQQKNDPRVQQAFNKFLSKDDRRRYDAVLDKMKREDPDYDTPQDQLAGLAIQYDGFLESDAKNGKALFVSSGGAGAGKSYLLKKMVEVNGMKMYDPTDPNQSPTDPDIDVVEMSSDIEDEKDFFKRLHDYNGKILVFDDKDYLLTTGSGRLNALMKNIADGDYTKRTFPGSNGKPEVFTGKLLFITNKSGDQLSKNEDKKAILSRGIFNDIKFTVNETIEVLKDRYKTIGGSKKGIDKKDEMELRQKVFDSIMTHVDEIDPDKFTVRKFDEILEKCVSVLRSKEKAEKDSEYAKLVSGSSGKKLDIDRQVMSFLKSFDDEFEKSSSREIFDNLSKKDIERYREKYEKDPKNFEELFGKKLVDFINETDTDETEEEEEVIKSIIDNDFDVRIDEALNAF